MGNNFKLSNVFKYLIFCYVQLNSQSTGMIMSGVGRLQINFELVPVKEIDVMANLPPMIFPWLWFEEAADIPEYLVNLLKYTLVL